METDGDSAGFSPFSTFVGSFQAIVADTWMRRSASSLLKTEGVRYTTSIVRLRADTLWSNDRVTFRFYSETAVFFSRPQAKQTKKTELGWDYRTAVIGKKLLHYHVLHLYFCHSVCHIHGIYDIHIVLTSIIFFLLYSRETTLRWHTIWFLNWSFLLNSGI